MTEIEILKKIEIVEVEGRKGESSLVLSLVLYITSRACSVSLYQFAKFSNLFFSLPEQFSFI